jgi:hypothetical protein
MDILPTTGTQELKIIPRKDAESPVIRITDKATRTTSTITPTKSDDGDYMVLNGDFSLTEDSLYTYRVELSISDNEEIYRGLIYCSNQTSLDKYFINKDEYIEESSFDNEYVII